jgi:hypothetical protein
VRPTIFISYRREDSQHVTGRLYDRLKARFGGNVMLDIDSLPLGLDFREHINRSLQDCKCVLAVIGDDWLDIRYKDGPLQGSRRIDDPADFVRVEIQVALDRGIPVIPVLLGSASMPGADKLPTALQTLAFRNGMELRSGRDFDSQIDRLIKALQTTAATNTRLKLAAVLGALVITALAAALVVKSVWSPRPIEIPREPSTLIVDSAGSQATERHEATRLDVAAQRPSNELSAKPSKFAAAMPTSGTALRRTRRAVLVGVDQYKNIPSLRFCGTDVEALRNELLAGGFAQDHVVLLSSNSAERLLPSKAHVAEQIHAVLASAGADDFVLLAFSGSGYEAEGSRFLCPSDADPSNAETMISFEWLCDELRACRSNLKVVLVDACRIPTGLKNQPGKVPVVSGGCLILSGCDSGEIAFESEEDRHGVFTNYVLQGLAGQADANKDGRVTALELWEYASPATEAYVQAKYHRSQRPTLEGNLTGEFRSFGLVEPGSTSTR